MPRHKNPEIAAPTDRLNHEALQADSQALTVLGQRSAEVAQRFGDGQPYERHRVVSEARFFMAASAEAMFELGKRLIQLKENEPHGDFTVIVTEQLAMPIRQAQLFMSAAVKLSALPAPNAKSLSHLGKTKLYDLLDEPADDLMELSEGGTVAGLNLDDMQAMSSRELRAALVEARKKAAAKDAVIAKKDQKLNELTEAEERRRSAAPDEREAAQLADVREAGLAAEMAVRRLVVACAEVADTPASDAAGTAARQAVEFVAQVLAGLINERGFAVDFGEMVTPHWLRGVAPAARG